jgi:hypothetical protein
MSSYPDVLKNTDTEGQNRNSKAGQRNVCRIVPRILPFASLVSIVALLVAFPAKSQTPESAMPHALPTKQFPDVLRRLLNDSSIADVRRFERIVGIKTKTTPGHNSWAFEDDPHEWLEIVPDATEGAFARDDFTYLLYGRYSPHAEATQRNRIGVISFGRLDRTVCVTREDLYKTFGRLETSLTQPTDNGTPSVMLTAELTNTSRIKTNFTAFVEQDGSCINQIDIDQWQLPA